MEDTTDSEQYFDELVEFGYDKLYEWRGKNEDLGITESSNKIVLETFGRSLSNVPIQFKHSDLIYVEGEKYKVSHCENVLPEQYKKVVALHPNLRTRYTIKKVYCYD